MWIKQTNGKVYPSSFLVNTSLKKQSEIDTRKEKKKIISFFLLSPSSPPSWQTMSIAALVPCQSRGAELCDMELMWMFSCGHDSGSWGSLAETQGLMCLPNLLQSLFSPRFSSQSIKSGHCFDPDECCGGKRIQDWEIYPSCSNEEPPKQLRVSWTAKASWPLYKWLWHVSEHGPCCRTKGLGQKRRTLSPNSPPLSPALNLNNVMVS